MRPGILFAVLFIWFVCTGGRFTAPFLKEVAHFEDGLIGTVFATQVLAGRICGSLGAVVADKLELLYPHYGRIGCFVACVVVGTIAFEVHFLVEYLTDDESVRAILHFMARVLYSISTSILDPTVDAITLTKLKDGNENESGYGRERLFGKGFFY